jgi:hypothetical protein
MYLGISWSQSHTGCRPAVGVSTGIVKFSFLRVTAEQRVRGIVVGVEILGAMIFTPSKINAELTRTPGRPMTQAVSRRPPRRPGFAPRSIRVGFVVDKVALGQVFLRVFLFSPVNILFHRRSPNVHHPGMNNVPASSSSSET